MALWDIVSGLSGLTASVHGQIWSQTYCMGKSRNIFFFQKQLQNLLLKFLDALF